ncbi:[SSU ribosomal protein S18P]-alanine acetyltransferase [Haloactinopolyspora alba]|uniref:[SSU ribosomal protein S18P]-alanine acetyltransferase n=1 Tax=Haloactinopolyspora alba TaxID=648780 RepID=A0A2P8DPH5_9ACTN|nr:ribosomal protein S18-alanine N-acetyltransferase [Haloactinopolyspora alba]PSK99110.1 [SSU ribosomal protein S18P]-alanine acetyltransferase [Haloactinopolyspora alba]
MRWWDIEAILPLEDRLFAGDSPWSAESFWSELAGVPESRWYVVAEEHGVPVAYAGLLAPSIPGEPADVQTIAVAPECQRRGYGSELMNALVAEAARRGAGDLLLDVRTDNEPAKAFYARHGFERIAVRRNYYQGGRDGIVMRRRVRRRAADQAADQAAQER